MSRAQLVSLGARELTALLKGQAALAGVAAANESLAAKREACVDIVVGYWEAHQAAVVAFMCLRRRERTTELNFGWEQFVSTGDCSASGEVVSRWIRGIDAAVADAQEACRVSLLLPRSAVWHPVSFTGATPDVTALARWRAGAGVWLLPPEPEVRRIVAGAASAHGHVAPIWRLAVAQQPVLGGATAAAAGREDIGGGVAAPALPVSPPPIPAAAAIGGGGVVVSRGGAAGGAAADADTAAFATAWRAPAPSRTGPSTRSRDDTPKRNVSRWR